MCVEVGLVAGCVGVGESKVKCSLGRVLRGGKLFFGVEIFLNVFL